MLVEFDNVSSQLAETNFASREKIDELQNAMMQLPQAPGMLTEHFFAGGMYCRRMLIPANTYIVSKVHNSEHLFIGCSGELFVAGQGEDYILKPGDVVVSQIGTKRAVKALTDVIAMTIHKTDKTSTEGLEAELILDDGLAMYDVNNQPKDGVCISPVSINVLEN